MSCSVIMLGMMGWMSTQAAASSCKGEERMPSAHARAWTSAWTHQSLNLHVGRHGGSHGVQVAEHAAAAGGAAGEEQPLRPAAGAHAVGLHQPRDGGQHDARACGAPARVRRVSPRGARRRSATHRGRRTRTWRSCCRRRRTRSRWSSTSRKSGRRRRRTRANSKKRSRAMRGSRQRWRNGARPRLARTAPEACCTHHVGVGPGVDGDVGGEEAVLREQLAPAGGAHIKLERLVALRARRPVPAPVSTWRGG